MARCEGTTKDGARCRRSASNGSTFCSWHAREAETETDPVADEQEPDMEQSGSEPESPSSRKHPLAGFALLGVVAVALLALRRVIRF